MVRRLLTPRWLALHVLAIVAMFTCFRLGWWQWDRSMSLTGTLQNLGYALQWPLFGLFIPFVYWRMAKLEREKIRAEESTQEVSPAAPVFVAKRRSPTEWRDKGTEIEEQDQVFATYNTYLAKLNARD